MLDLKLHQEKSLKQLVQGTGVSGTENICMKGHKTVNTATI
jgi:hypothetical protein